jgi:hypothetical protein
MKLRIFQSDKGDCLLLTGANGEHVLIDGGMAAAYERHVRAALGGLAEQGVALDLVYVSHIDEDHISGVLQMMDDQVQWLVHDFQVAQGNTGHAAPAFKRPPEVRGIWHNAFHEAVDQNAGLIENLLAATAGILYGSDDEALLEVAEQHSMLATSEAQAIKLSRRIGARQLNIPLNREFGGKLAMFRQGQAPVQLGGLKITVLAPFAADLRVLRKQWNAWLEANMERLKEIKRQAKRDERMLELLGLNAFDRFVDSQVALAGSLGDRSRVTPPNLASLMLLVEEGQRRLLLTGDGHGRDIIAGLKRTGHLSSQHPKIHLDTLKVQHHGSEFNADKAFWATVTADHYVLCANGEHDNPDLRIIDEIVKSRLVDGDQRPFKLWFSSHASVIDVFNAQGQPSPKMLKARDHMVAVEQRLEALAAQSHGRLQVFFNTDDSVELDVAPLA